MSNTTEQQPILKRIESLTKKIEKAGALRRERAELMRDALASHSRGEVATAAHMSRHAVSDAVARLESDR